MCNNEYVKKDRETWSNGTWINVMHQTSKTGYDYIS